MPARRKKLDAQKKGGAKELMLREADLPDWARHELWRLRNLVKAAEAMLEEPGESNTFLTDHTYDDMPLGKSPYIAFGTDRDLKFRVKLQGPGIIEVQGPAGPCFVRPMAANLFQIYAKYPEDEK